MWEAIIALGLSLARSLGGKNGALAEQIFNTAASIKDATDDVKNTLTPWIVWANSIVDANRDATTEEETAANALADAVRAQNRALASGTAYADLPPLPSPPSA
jgi:hypothetical protein